jgi:hypothetical protein
VQLICENVTINKEVHYRMSQKQLFRYVTISKLIESQITTEETGIYFGLSQRQILRLKKIVTEKWANWSSLDNPDPQLRHFVHLFIFLQTAVTNPYCKKFQCI